MRYFAAALILQFTVTFVQAQDLRLWYTQPATTWNEALPIGNGRLAAMVFGNPSQEKLQLNEETVWAGEPGNNIPITNFAASLPEIRKLIFDGKYEAAHELAMKVVPRDAGADNNYGMPYQTVGNLLIDFPGHQNATSYRRELDIASAVSTSRYSVGDVMFTRETIASFTDQAIVVHITASKKKSCGQKAWPRIMNLRSNMFSSSAGWPLIRINGPENRSDSNTTVTIILQRWKLPEGFFG